MSFEYLGRTLAASIIMMLFLSAPAAAQTGLARGSGLEDLPRIGIGYVANGPSIFTGVAAWGVVDAFGGLGLYVDAKYDFSTPGDEPDFIDDLTVVEVESTPGQTFQFDESGWWSANVALVRPLSPELMLYLGGGYAHRDHYRRYSDPNEQLVQGQLGWYWVRDDAASGGRVNVLGGAFFRIGRQLVLQFGLESEPNGATVGVSYTRGLR